MSKLRSKLIAVLAVLLCAMLCISTAFLISKSKTVQANSVKSPAIDLGYGTNRFNGFNLDTLYGYISSGATSYDELKNSLSGSNGDILKTYADIYGGNGVTIKLGSDAAGNAYEWNVVAVSKNQDGDVVVTLWLAKTSYVSTFSYKSFTNNSSTTYSPNEYAMSLARSTFVNNAEYATSLTAKTRSDNSTYNKYWKSFLENYGEYIDSPYDVCGESGYQATEKSITSNINQPYLLANEAYIKYTETGTGAEGKWNNSTVARIQTLDDYGNWRNDKLWLPSISETGHSATYSGLWNITEDTVRAAATDTWLRSSYSTSADGLYCLFAKGDLSAYTAYAFSCALRPALHLNLLKAEENSDRLLTVDEVSTVYNGKAQDLNTLTTKPSWYREDIFTDISKVRIECPANMIDVDEYNVNVTLLDTDKYGWSDGNTSSATRTFKYKITKAPLNMQTLKVDENGKLQGDGSVNDIITGTYLSTSVYERDVGKSTAPKFGLEYKRTNGGSWSTTAPETAGEYYVRAYIINASTSYYYLESDGQTTFTKPKEYVETPHFTKDGIDSTAIVGSTTTVQYSGDYQEFKLVNTPDDKLVGVTVGAREGGLSYDQKTGMFRAKAVGIYTVEVLLEDGGANTQWDSSATEISRTITLIITKADLTVNILESDMTSWTKGDIDYLTVQVSGVKNGENVKLDVYYQVKGSDNKTYVADSAMILDEESGIITVTVNLATFDSNKQYQLYVSLRDNISANDNYTLINNSAPFEFFIMTATINDEDVVGAWKISNLIYGTKEAIDGIEVDYNGLEYTLSLDESKLIKGLEATYSNESFKDADSYTTTVLLTCQPGYQLASGKSSISFEICWKINPIEYDIAELIWASNPEWDNNKTLTMSIINLPSWLTGDYVSYSDNEEKLVNSYTATCQLYSDGNYIFVYSGSDSGNYIIDRDGLLATITHEWSITKKIINVTNAPKQWTTEAVTYQADDTYYYYNIYVPTGIEEKYLKVTYYSNPDLSEESKVEDIRQIAVDYSESKTYYIKIEIADDWASTCELYNTLTKGDFASTSFRVGGNMEIIEVTYDGAEEYMYDGQAHGITARYRDLQFTYKYYKIGEESPLEGEPTEVGDYRVVIAVEGADSESYWIQNSVFYFTITPLVLTTNGYKPATGNELKESYVIADVDVDTSEFFEYQIFKNNQRVYAPLEYNTTYTVKLVIKDEHKEHAVWADDAVTTYIFTTSFNPDDPTKFLQDPTITATDNDGNTVKGDSVVWTGDDFTVTINDWENIKAYVDVTVDGGDELTIAEDGSFKVSAVGLYTVTITIKEEAKGAAEWLWDDGTDSKSVTFEIVKRYVGIPVANGELMYTGEEQYLFPEGYEENYITLSDGAVISATEIGGEWRLKLILKDKENSCWADGTTDDLIFSWSIVKAEIGGKWDMKDGVAEFFPDDEVYADKFTTKYYDADGNEIAVEDMVEGKTYTAKITIKDEYAEKCGFAEGVETEYEFTYGALSEGDLENRKEQAKKDLEDVAQKKKDEIDADPDLTDEEKEKAKAEVDAELQKGKDAIDRATDEDGINSAFNEAKKNIEDLSFGGESSFPWWIIAVIGAALLLLALLIIIIVKRRQAVDGDDEYDDYYDDEYDYDEEEYEEEDFGDEDF